MTGFIELVSINRNQASDLKNKAVRSSSKILKETEFKLCKTFLLWEQLGWVTYDKKFSKYRWSLLECWLWVKSMNFNSKKNISSCSTLWLTSRAVGSSGDILSVSSNCRSLFCTKKNYKSKLMCRRHFTITTVSVIQEGRKEELSIFFRESERKRQKHCMNKQQSLNSSYMQYDRKDFTFNELQMFLVKKNLRGDLRL